MEGVLLLWNFIKNLFFFRETDELSELMRRANDLTMMDAKLNSIPTGDLIESFLNADSSSPHDSTFAMTDLENQQHEDFINQQLHADLHDPHLHPGLDIVVDETYHGIDHGSSFHDTSDHHSDFGSGGHDGF